MGKLPPWCRLVIRSWRDIDVAFGFGVVCAVLSGLSHLGTDRVLYCVVALGVIPLLGLLYTVWRVKNRKRPIPFPRHD